MIADLIGKGRHIRTVPVPLGRSEMVDGWTEAAGITTGRIFRRVSRFGQIHATRMKWYVTCSCEE